MERIKREEKKEKRWKGEVKGVRGKEVMKRIKREEKKEKDGREKLKGKGGRK